MHALLAFPEGLRHRRLDPFLAFVENLAQVRNYLGLHAQQARNDLKVVLYAMVNLLQQDLFGGQRRSQ